MANPYSLQLILPVGISFYTFQTMSYTIDIYKRQIEPTKDPIDFFAFVSFFPQLVAGPIERASNLLPQFFAKRNFTYEKGKLGMELILWGLFKKVVIADNCALVVNQIFERVDDASSIELLLGMFLFSFQIYGDFSGYSDIAIGVGSLLGFTLMTNFKTPYFSVDIVDFWRRWHISLSTWFRDYVYIPLGGSKINLNITFRNIFLVFLVSGFWHGANWTFVFWGAIHSILFIFVIWNYQRSSEAKLQKTGFFYKKITPFLSGLLTFVIVTIAWIFFRSTTLQGAFQYLSNIWINFDIPSSLRLAYQVPVFFVLLMMVMEWRGKDKNSVFEVRSLNLKYSLYFVFFLSILFYGAFVDSHQFIYFQF
jgi:D-alanyl-lipoteichoic acid acyltransferase DltB (MBOAT superfamily)